MGFKFNVKFELFYSKGFLFTKMSQLTSESNTQPVTKMNPLHPVEPNAINYFWNLSRMKLMITLS